MPRPTSILYDSIVVAWLPSEHVGRAVVVQERALPRSWSASARRTTRHGPIAMNGSVHFSGSPAAPLIVRPVRSCSTSSCGSDRGVRRWFVTYCCPPAHAGHGTGQCRAYARLLCAPLCVDHPGHIGVHSGGVVRCLVDRVLALVVGRALARFYCLSWTAVFVGVSVLTAEQVRLVANFWVDNASQIGILSLVVLLSFTLANRSVPTAACASTPKP